MKSELVVFTENNKVVSVASEVNLEKVINSLLEKYDTYMDEFESGECLVFLEEKGINTTLVNLDIN